MTSIANASAGSYASGTSDVPLLGDTIGANLEATVTRFGDREALVDASTGRRLTYAELDAAVDDVARGLLALDVGKGDRVGIWAPNCVEWVLVQYATAKIGAILVNVNPAYRTHEVGFVLRQSGVSVLVSATTFKTSNYAAMVEEVRGDCPVLREVVLIGTPSWAALIEGAERVQGDAASPAASSSSHSGDSNSTTRSSASVRGRTSSIIAA